MSNVSGALESAKADQHPVSAVVADGADGLELAFGLGEA